MIEASSSSSSSSISNTHSRHYRPVPTRRRQSSSSLQEDKSIVFISKRNKKKTRKTSSTALSSSSSEYESDLVPLQQKEEQDFEAPSLDEIRASLGPIGRTIASGVEVGVVTAGSYISGGALGYGMGGLFGFKTLFTSSSTSSAASKSSTFTHEMRQRVGDWNSNSLKQASQWAKLSAAFSGFHALSRVLRNGKEDKWNGIIGSAATGAYLSREAGPRAMIQGSASYAGITYLLDVFFGAGAPNSSRAGKDALNQEFQFTDVPTEE